MGLFIFLILFVIVLLIILRKDSDGSVVDDRTVENTLHNDVPDLKIDKSDKGVPIKGVPIYDEMSLIRNHYTYDELLKTSLWKDKKMRIMQRDGMKCRYCNNCDPWELQVHHKYYSQMNICGKVVKVYPWDYPDDALITLCDRCHKKVHEQKRIKTYFRKRYEHYK